MTAPDIAVVLPFRDAEDTLAEAIESVLADTSARVELMLVDDGSRDASPAIAARFAERTPHVRLLHGEGAGLVHALNLGLAAARTQYVARMDADDVTLPGRFAAQRDALSARPALAVVGTKVEGFPADAVGEGLARYIDWQNGLLDPEDHARQIFVESPLCHPSVMMRRAAVQGVGGYRDEGWAEDYDLWLRLHAAGKQMLKIDQTLLRWRHRSGRETFSSPRCSLAQFRALRATFLAPWLLERNKRIAIWGAGPTGKRLARELERHGVRAYRFLDIDPRKCRTSARGLAVEPPETFFPDREMVVVAVGARGARDLIRAELERRELVEGEHYVCAA